jgi:DNA-directed RNA polymerase specialized sigma24 family protein
MPVDADHVAFVKGSWARYVLLTGDRHRAEELLQDSLVRLYVHRSCPR